MDATRTHARTLTLYNVTVSEVRRNGTEKRLARWQHWGDNYADTRKTAERMAFQEFPNAGLFAIDIEPDQ